MRPILSLFLAISVTLVSGSLASAQSLKSFCADAERARQFISSGQYAEADRLTAELVAAAQKRFAAEERASTELNNIGLAYFRRGRYDRARRAFMPALTISENIDAKSLDTGIILDNLGVIASKQGRYQDAERYEQRALAIREKALPGDSPLVALSHNNLGTLYQRQNRYSEAEQHLKDAIDIYRKKTDKSLDLARSLDNLGTVYERLGRYSESEALYKEALKIREAQLDPMHVSLASTLNNLGVLYKATGRYTEAEPLYERAIRIWEHQDHPSRAWGLDNLATLRDVLGHYSEAEEPCRRALNLRLRTFGEGHPEVATSYNNLALILDHQGKHAEAEDLYRRALEAATAQTGDDPDTATRLNNLGSLLRDLGKFDEAEPLLKRAVEIQESRGNGEPSALGYKLSNLAVLYDLLGQHAQAEKLHLRALNVYESGCPSGHPDIATGLHCLAFHYSEQRRYEKAEPLLRKAMEIWEAREMTGHPAYAACLNTLGTLLDDQGRNAEAEEVLLKALEANEKVFGENHLNVAINLQNLAGVYWDLDRNSDAEPLFRRSLRIFGQKLGTDHPTYATALTRLAGLARFEGRASEAESLCSQAVETVRKTGVCAPRFAVECFVNRAQLYWALGREEEAIDDLEEAMTYAGQVREHASGGDVHRSMTFASYVGVFEVMLDWQAKLGELTVAFQTIERCRAQGLQDLMQSNGMDLLEGVPEQTASELREAAHVAQAEVASLLKQIEVLHERTDLASKKKAKKTEDLVDLLDNARESLVQAWADIKNASPAYRMVVTENREPVPFEAFQQELGKSDTVALQYLLGEKNGFLLAYGGGIEPALITLEISDTQSEVFGCDAGPLTAARFRQVLLGNKDRPGLLRDLTTLGEVTDEGLPSKETLNALRTLWAVLVPDETLREKLVDGESFKRLLILPDGVLARLPFEALVVNDDPQAPEYLLDNGPPTMYAPSATVFHNLKQREVSASKGETLTVGNPSYGSTAQPGDRGTVLEELQIASRFAHLGRLADLPWTGDESCWIKESCEDKHLPVVQLTKEKATEENVRNNVRGRSLVHFACHGLADNEYGNLFGALALAPVDAGDPSNDGFLTVAEMFDLDLHACELAILSACDTNIGPNQRGEGTWSMCRGILTSGARRVVTTDWQVADEASAHLVYAFVYYLHDSESQARDYAECLRNARLSIRNHDNRQWRHPYFWAPFVLMGPE